ncbi:DUF2778 domain-containing protein [Serratia sp. BNK-17]|uniref:DUF2778 domain-containing protein n=1 Tax=Serratia sp. BNK-17 TaxID=3376154 RepID=UPI003B438006
MIHGRFRLNRDTVTLLECGVNGNYPAFSGNGKYTNQPGCTHKPDDGALPAGRYWIVDRPTGGIGSQALTWAKDFVNRTDHATWFALYRDDHRIDDFTWINSVKRGQFRLHPIGPARLSLGCITLYNAEDFVRLRERLLRTPRAGVPRTNNKLMAYGSIDVIGYERRCTV